MRPSLRQGLLGLLAAVLFGAVNAHHIHPADELSAHVLPSVHHAHLAAAGGHQAHHPRTAGDQSGDQSGDQDAGHPLLPLCLAALVGTIGLVGWLFARGRRPGRGVSAPTLSRPPPRPPARCRPPTGTRVLARLCVLRT